MAIEITKFNYPGTYAQNIHEVYDWLVANASEYFPGGIVKDTGTYTITCYPIEGDDVTAIRIPFAPTGGSAYGLIRPKYAAAGTNVNPNTGYYQDNAYEAAAKTSYGVVLKAWHYSAWFVTRTDTGSVCTLAYGTPGASSTVNWNVFFSDLENDRAASTLLSSNINSYLNLINNIRQKTSWSTTTLLPVTFSCGTYAPDMFMTHFTQADFSGDLRKVLIDGEEYVYDGFIALKG